MDLEIRHRAMRISGAVQARCTLEQRVSIAWPNETELVARCMVQGRFQYRSFTVTTEDETADAIVKWVHSEAPRGKTP